MVDLKISYVDQIAYFCHAHSKNWCLQRWDLKVMQFYYVKMMVV